MRHFAFFQLARRLAVCLLTGVVGVGAVWLLLFSQTPRAAQAATATLSPTPSWVADGTPPNMLFGTSLASGDINNDGYTDAIIGASGDLSKIGRAFVYLGSATGLASTPAFIFTRSANGASVFLVVNIAGDVNGDGYADVLIGESYPYDCTAYESRVYVFYGSAAGLNDTPALTLTEPTSCNAYGASLATAGDVNNDGYADVVIGANGYMSNTGRIYVHLGSPNGLASTPAFTTTGEATGNWFGLGVSSVGDVNGDGFGDILATAMGYNNSQGRVYVYLGAAIGITSTPALTLTGPTALALLGRTASGAGDVNGDSYDDFLISLASPFEAQVYLGGSTLNATPALTLTSTNVPFVSAAGDVNGDGYADVMIAAPGVPYTGSVSVYAGSATGLQATPIFTATGEAAGDSYGAALSPAGDVNGDHVDDLLVAAYYHHQDHTGRVYGYYGVADASHATLSTTPSWVADGMAPNTFFGFNVASAGDVNNDGYADVIIGADGYLTDTDQAFLYFGSATGLASTPAFTLAGSSIGAWMGLAVSTAGDVNGDGYADVMIGGSSQTNCVAHESRVKIFYGSAAGLNDTATLTLTEPTGCSGYGYSLATAGDVNDDGYSDVVIGANGYMSNTGRIYVYLGSPSGLASTPAFIATGEAESNSFGLRVASMGDVNGDGFSDILATAPGYGSLRGRAYVYLGAATSINSTPALTLTGAVINSGLGYSASGAGDVNGDGYADFLIGSANPPRTLLYFGGANLDPVSAMTFTVDTPAVAPRSTAGDVNGDGYADIMISAVSVQYTGSVYVYAGSASGVQATPIFTATGETAGDAFGAALNTAGDVNGDHIDDILISAYLYQNPAGRVYAYYGVADAPVTLPPQAISDVYALSEDSPLTVFTATGVLTNDTAADLNLLTAVSATLPATGTLALQTNGSFTYTPPLNFNGLVTFTYRAFDETAYSPPAVVTLTVTPVNDAPTLSTMADQVILFNTSTSPLPFTIGDVDNLPSTLTVTAISDNPTLIPNSGLAVGGSNSARTLTLTPALNQTGAATLTLTVTDGTIPVNTSFHLTVTALRLYLPFILR